MCRHAGGRSREGRPIITFPDRCNFATLTEDNYRKLIVYLTSVPAWVCFASLRHPSYRIYSLGRRLVATTAAAAVTFVCCFCYICPPFWSPCVIKVLVVALILAPSNQPRFSFFFCITIFNCTPASPYNYRPSYLSYAYAFFDRLHDADLGYVLIVDRRGDRWNAVKATLLRLSVRFDCFEIVACLFLRSVPFFKFYFG